MAKKRISHTYTKDNTSHKYILINKTTKLEYTLYSDSFLEESEIQQLEDLITYLPSSIINNLGEKFLNLDLNNYSKNLLTIAANSCDNFDNTMLGIAANYGGENSILACEKLLKMGANINSIDKYNKLPLHWAIANNKSYYNKKSPEESKIVQFLLDNDARTDIKSYQNSTPLEYAKSREYTAAAKMIEDHESKLWTSYVIGTTKDTSTKISSLKG